MNQTFSIRRGAVPRLAARNARAARRLIEWASRPIPTAAWDWLAFALVVAGYLLAFGIAKNSLSEALDAVARNAVPLIVLLACARAMAIAISKRSSGILALVLHGTAAVVASAVFYLLVLVVTGLFVSRSPVNFEVRPFLPSSASIWQLLQGMLLYALVALIQLAKSLDGHDQSSGQHAGVEPAMSPRFFVRIEGEARPLDLSRVLLIAAADDYCDVTTDAGHHLVRLTMSEFERQLDKGAFCRVHRSAIVNVQRIESFEPDGSGRLLIRMDNGETVRSSRSGAAQLRQRLI